jgi:Lon protease-like protein
VRRTHLAALLLSTAALLPSPLPVAAQEIAGDQVAIARGLPDGIPLLTLPEETLFPNAPRRLEVVDARDRALLADAMKGNRIIGIVMPLLGLEADSLERPPIFEVGCAGLITKIEERPDGHLNVLLRGLVKFRVTDEDNSRAYRFAHVVALPERPNASQASTLKGMRQRLDDLLWLSIDHFGVEPPPLAIPDEDVVNVVSQYADINPFQRQRLLEQEGVLARSRALVDLLETLSRMPR